MSISRPIECHIPRFCVLHIQERREQAVLEFPRGLKPDGRWYAFDLQEPNGEPFSEEAPGGPRVIFWLSFASELHFTDDESAWESHDNIDDVAAIFGDEWHLKSLRTDIQIMRWATGEVEAMLWTFLIQIPEGTTHIILPRGNSLAVPVEDGDKEYPFNSGGPGRN